MSALSLSAARKAWLPYAVLGLAILLFAWGAIFVRLAQAQGMPSLAIATIRYGAACLVLTPYVLSRQRAALRQLSRRDIALNALAGFLFVSSLVLFYSALEHTTILIANVINNTHPLWVGLVEVLAMGVVLGRRVWVGLALALGGLVLFALAGVEDFSHMGSDPLLGAGLCLVAAFVGSGYFLLARILRRRVSTLIFMWIAMLSGSLLALLVCLLSGTALLGYPAMGYVWTLTMSFTAQLIGHSLMAFSLAHLPATLVSMSNQVVVVLSAILAFLIFAETPGPLQILASGVILSGVAITITRRPPEAAA